MSNIKYVVYSTSNSPYQDWQCELLDYTYHKVNQPGKLIRLCSEDDGYRGRPFRDSKYAEVVRMRSWITNETTGDFWGIANKLNSTREWLYTYPNLTDDEPVLFLDPDMIFIKPVTYNIYPGEVIGQRWLDHGIETSRHFDFAQRNRHLITKTFVVMYPFCITVGDMKTILDRYISLSYEIRETVGCWEADMYGLIISMAEYNLKLKTEVFGIFTAWKDYRDKLYSIIHYPNKIYSDEEETDVLWFKQDYTKDTLTRPWKLPPHPSQATNITEKMLLAVIREYIETQQ